MADVLTIAAELRRLAGLRNFALSTYRIIEHPSRGGGPPFRQIARINQ